MRSRSAAALLVAAGLIAGSACAAERLNTIEASGLRATLDELAGEVVLVNFWATWCAPCLKEIPVLMGLESELAGSGFRLVAVSLDEADSIESQVQPFMQKWFPEFTTYLSLEADMDDIVSVIDGGWNEVLPTSYLIGRDGRMAERIQGSYTKAEFRAAITPLLAEERPQ